MEEVGKVEGSRAGDSEYLNLLLGWRLQRRKMIGGRGRAGDYNQKK